MPGAPSSSSSSSDDNLFNREAWVSTFAGALAGIISDGITHPISTAKSRMQVLKPEAGVSNTTLSLMRHIVRTEGLSQLYAGIGVIAIAAPARALYFLGYEVSKKQGEKLFGEKSPIAHIVSGPIAQLSGSLLWVPMDVVKERMQVQRAPANTATLTPTAGGLQAEAAHSTKHYSSSFRCLVGIARDEGVKGLYRGYVTHQVVWGPFNAVYFAVYEFLKNAALDAYVHSPAAKAAFAEKNQANTSSSDAADGPHLPSFVYPICGAIAGCSGAAVTAPLDLIKTRLQTQGKSGRYKGAIDCFKKIISEEGAATLTRGMGARCAWLAPNVAITMTTYELIRKYFM